MTCGICEAIGENRANRQDNTPNQAPYFPLLSQSPESLSSISERHSGVWLGVH